MRACTASRLAITSLAVAAATPALAHEGPAHSHGLAGGFIHPFTGLDHLVAIIGVGLLTTISGRKVRWDIPLSFLASFAMGGMLGMGRPLASIETGVAISVICVGFVILTQRQGSHFVAAPLAGVTGFLHGWAHGGEQSPDSSGLLFLAGALAASLMLSSSSAAVGRYIASLSAGQKLIQRLTGGAIILAGIGVVSS